MTLYALAVDIANEQRSVEELRPLLMAIDEYLHVSVMFMAGAEGYGLFKLSRGLSAVMEEMPE